MPENASTEHRQFLRVSQAADRVQVSTYTIRGWVKSGRLRGYHFGVRTLRIDQAELDALGGA